jgi:DNA-binding GntR family transcriptional regulator
MAESTPSQPNGAVFQPRPDRQLVTDWVYEEIRGAIVDLRLAPGAPLREAAIASQLGVSKTPVREALGRLEQEGLVEATSFKRAAATDADEETLAALRAVIEQSRAARDAGDLAALAELLGRFDQIMFEQVANVRIRGLIETLRAHLTRIGKLTEEIPGRVEASVEEHAAIVDAVARGDADGAERAMRVHIGSVRGDQLAGMDTGGEP